MGLTHASRNSKQSDNFPTAQLLLLALVRVAEPVALTSFLPYAFKAVHHYHFGDKNDAAFYAGILIAAFSFAEAITGVFWGGVSDRVGRKPVLLLGCVGTLVSLLIVGFASNFWIALFGRLLGGLLNGNVGVIQTMVSELVQNPAHEPKAFAVMPAVWSIGTIAGPAIGGCFSDPADNFPSVFSKSGVFGRYPYLLPNVICATLMLFSIVAGKCFLRETHPDMQPWSTKEELDCTSAETPLLPTNSTTTTAPANLTTESYGTFNPVHIVEDVPDAPTLEKRSSTASVTSTQKAFCKPVMMLIVSLGLFTYHAMTYDALLPVYLQDDVDLSAPLAGGLGLQIQEVGIIMSVNGLLALFIQAVVFPFLAGRMGIWPLFVTVATGFPIVYLIVPVLQLLPADWLTVGIYTCLTIRNLFSIIFYPLILILLKEAAPSPTCLGKINGLAASTGGACRMLASPVAGMLYGIGLDVHFSPLVWWVSAGVAALGAMQVPFVQRQKNKRAHIGTAAEWAATTQEDEGLAGGQGAANTKQKMTWHVAVMEVCGDDDDAQGL